MSITERFQSWRRERRITRLCRQACRLQRTGDGVGSRVAFMRMSREIEQRTDEQIERMDRTRRLERRRTA